MYLQFYPSGKDIRDKTYEQVANIFANVAPLQKISIDFMRLKLRQNGSLVQASVLQYSADIAKILANFLRDTVEKSGSRIDF